MIGHHISRSLGPSVVLVLLVLLALVPLSICQSGTNPAASQSAGSSTAQAAYRRGMLAVQQRDLTTARSEFETVVSLSPSSPDAHNALGWVLLLQGRGDAAIEQLRIALKLKPAFVQAHINLANALAQTKNLDGALAEAKETVRLSPRDAEAHRTLGRVLGLQQDLPGAESELRRAAELDSKRPDLRDELGSVLHVRAVVCPEFQFLCESRRSLQP